MTWWRWWMDNGEEWKKGLRDFGLYQLNLNFAVPEIDENRDEIVEQFFAIRAGLAEEPE